MTTRARSDVRNLLEYIPAWLILHSLTLMPRRLALAVGGSIARSAYYFHRKLRRVGYRNLELAMPNLSERERKSIVKTVFLNMGRLLGEFSQFPKLNRQTIESLVVYDGFENYRAAASRGRGVLFLTGHFGAWELCAFAHGLFGNRLNFLVRPLDNPRIDAMIARYRTLSGNRVIDKNRSVKPVLKALANGEAVGFLADANTLPDQGVFCEFFGIPACSTTGLAVFAQRTGAPVIPGFLFWDSGLGKYTLRFEPEIPLINTGDFKDSVRLNTARFTKVIEDYCRRYPDQWLWIHKRWKTRPDGEPDLYAVSGPPPVSPHSTNISLEA
ncbi:MAG TPA: lysophospholipid acyltransferase family protein [Blastocatellia bacterium]|nr:lysophospholipid acyltransferase family protein [Blastocatellia bacterium]